MLGLTLLGVTLVVNFVQHLRGKSTICSKTREFLPIEVFIGIIAWLVAHWLKPFIRGRRA